MTLAARYDPLSRQNLWLPSDNLDLFDNLSVLNLTQLAQLFVGDAPCRTRAPAESLALSPNRTFLIDHEFTDLLSETNGSFANPSCSVGWVQNCNWKPKIETNRSSFSNTVPSGQRNNVFQLGEELGGSQESSNNFPALSVSV
jgi:hypothetical protein